MEILDRARESRGTVGAEVYERFFQITREMNQLQIFITKCLPHFIIGNFIAFTLLSP